MISIFVRKEEIVICFKADRWQICKGSYISKENVEKFLKCLAEINCE